jgi:hypothetical protein
MPVTHPLTLTLSREGRGNEVPMAAIVNADGYCKGQA